MSATLARPPAAPVQGSAPPAGKPAAAREDLRMVATMALLVAACLPLARVFIGLAFFRPVLGAMLLALGLAWGSRRLGAGPVTCLLLSMAGWLVFISAAFLGDTLYAGILPTPRTIGAAVTLWARGMLLVQLRPSPAFAEAGLMLLTITGVWAITHAVEGIVFRLAAPVKAILVALLLWVVPLAVAPETTRAAVWAVPFLAASALLLLSFAGADLRRWGAWAPAARHASDRTEPSLLPAGGLLAVIAIIAGTLLAGAVPGFGDKPWYELRGSGGTTLTTNPIVDIRSRLVAQDTGPIMRVTTDRPVYLRTTALDEYSENEEWTNSGIRASAVANGFPPEVPLGPVTQVRVEVEVENLPEAVLVPAPYQAVSVTGPMADDFRYDQTNSTVTLAAGRTLQRGDAYSIVAAIPTPPRELLDDAPVATGAQLRALPPNVPDEVRALAASIVRDAGATTPFEQALAIQTELRSWRYSTEPPQGHGGDAMLTFIRNRIGYCEQFAGTMAVMLRALDLPARVAVGYTPGDLVDRQEGTYTITNGNAHAWVEVLFDDIGWVAFEPTPRSDGNVLVPTATNVAPSQTVADPRDGRDPAIQGPERPDPANDNQNLGNLGNPQAPPAQDPPGTGGRTGGGAAGADDFDDGSLPVVLMALIGTAVVVGGGAAMRARRGGTQRPPLERVLRARSDVEHLGRGMGLVPAPWETDHEYLHRVAHRHGNTAGEAADVLATQTARARYARELPDSAAAEAEGAATSLRAEMLRGRSRASRAVVVARGRGSAVLSSAAGRVVQLSSSSRRRAPSR